MNKDKYVFAQFFRFLDHSKFRRLIDKYDGGFHVKHFTCRHQLFRLRFGQLSGHESLRNFATVLDAHKSKCHHLGLGAAPAPRNALLVANQKRNYCIFEDFAFFMMDMERQKCVKDMFMLVENAYAFDSTTIPLCLSVFHWTKFCN